MTISLRTDRRLIRARSSSTRYLLTSITAPEAPPRENRLPVNIALVLDRSGSMAGENKFPLAVDAVRQSLRLLDRNDRFSLVVFDEVVDVVMRSTLATSEAKSTAIAGLEAIEPRGSTDLCAGWMKGCDQIADDIGGETITRALLLTDGLANHGVVNHETLAYHAGELRQRGISTSTFGVGADFDERLLRDIASEGRGNFYFIENARQIPDLITSELGEALEVVIPRAALTLAIPRGASAEVINRFNSQKLHGESAIRIDVGDLVSGQELNVVIRIKLPHGEIGSEQSANATMSGDSALMEEADASVVWTYASHSDNDDQKRDRKVDRAVARVYSARARAEATEANRAGDFDRARTVLVRTARRIEEYAGEDRELLKLAATLRAEVPKYAEEVMEPMMMKSAFYSADLAVRERSFDGKAKRRATR